MAASHLWNTSLIQIQKEMALEVAGGSPAISGALPYSDSVGHGSGGNRWLPRLFWSMSITDSRRMSLEVDVAGGSPTSSGARS